MRKILFFLPVLVLVLAGACGQPGNLPIVVDKNPAKGIYSINPHTGVEEFRPIEMVCYVDTEYYNPLNALDYTLRDSGTRFFDYVVLGGAFINHDAKGYYLSLSISLKNLLARRNSILWPLQKKGIRVLLGIESGGGRASFGNLTEDEMNVFSKDIYQTLETWGLDGAELYDHGAGDEAYPQRDDYDPNNEDQLSEDEWLLEQWKKGGDSFNNIFYTVRFMYPDQKRNDVPLFLREANYGQYLPASVGCTAGYAAFAASVAQITYSFNTRYDLFPPVSAQRYQYYPDDDPYDPNGDTWITPDKFGPLAIDLDGGPEKNIFFPFMEKSAIDFVPSQDDPGLDFSYFYGNFKDGEYPSVYYHNLKSIDEAEADPYYKWVYYNPDKETTEFLDENDNIVNPKSVPALYLFDELSMRLFGEHVDCAPGGGNHKKTGDTSG